MSKNQDKKHKKHKSSIASQDTVFSIIRKNVFTYFNLVFAIITVLLLIAKSYRSLTFLPIIFANMGIGIFQQLRSKKVLDNLNVLAQASYKVERDGVEMTVPMDELEIGDVIFLEGGLQIPADGTLCEGTLNVNESLLTGEEDEIEKVDGSQLMSGSFVVSGKGKAKLTAVGEDCYAAQLTTKAKEIKNKKSTMVKNIELVIEVAGIVIIPIAIALYVEAVTLNHKTMSEAIVSMVGAIIGLIPEGLYLLLTVALALGAMFLAQKMVLLHDMRSIETLARVDVLCVDKTGTITSNEMSVTETFLSEGEDDAEQRALLTRYIHTVDDGNITMTAMKEYFGEGQILPDADVVPFTSKLKYSQVKTGDDMYRLGAPEILLSEETMEKCRAMIDERAAQGLRVLVFVKVEAEEKTVPLLFVVLKNGIRKNAPETFAYFKRQGVRVKVISGDNPVTVSKIATSVGIPHADQYVDATTLHTDEDIEEAVKKYTVFGRVKPEQKKSIVLALKKQKLKVAMTGDGVNDILAMKEADCSIAMGSGSDAARQAAQVVLLDSDFSRMKYIVSRGRQIINNITRSATLFLFKNIFSFLLAIFSIIAVFNYPLVPSHLSIVTTFNIGIPAFLLSLEPNIRKQKLSFFKKTLLTAGPAALTAFVSIAVLVIVGEANKLSSTSIGMISLYMLELAAVLILLHVARPFNWYRSIVVGISIGGFILFNFIPLTRNIYMLSSLDRHEWIIFLSFALVEFIIIQVFTFLFDRAKDQVNEQIEKIEKHVEEKK